MSDFTTFKADEGRLSGTQHQDAQLLADILPRRGLLAINTWDTSLGPTYQGGQGHLSRIDYVMVRHKTSDSITKKPIYLEHLPGKFGTHQGSCADSVQSSPTNWRGWKQPPLGSEPDPTRSSSTALAPSEYGLAPLASGPRHPNRQSSGSNTKSGGSQPGFDGCVSLFPAFWEVRQTFNNQLLVLGLHTLPAPPS